MFDVIKKLMLSRQIRMEKGKIFLLGQPIVMQPASVFAEIKKSIENKEFGKDVLYKAARRSGKKYMKKVSFKYGMKLSERIKWGLNSFEVGGWGVTEVSGIKVKEAKAIVQVRDSTVAREYGRSSVPVDDVMAGFIAGASCIFWNKEMDVIERKCEAMGDKVCEFLVLPTNEIKNMKKVR